MSRERNSIIYTTTTTKAGEQLMIHFCSPPPRKSFTILIIKFTQISMASQPGFPGLFIGFV